MYDYDDDEVEGLDDEDISGDEDVGGDDENFMEVESLADEAALQESGLAGHDEDD